MSSKEDYRYRVKFKYNGCPYSCILVSQKNLEILLKDNKSRFIIDTVEGAALSWVKTQGLLVHDAKLQNVCLCNENEDEIVYTGTLHYE